MFEADLNIFLRVVVAMVLSAILGWERESAQKAAGLRTHILVGMSSALFIALGEIIAADFLRFGEHIRFDAGRLIEAVVTGISFLGAGMIIFRKQGSGVQGLTTAAGILSSAGIGMLVGLHRYLLATGITLLVFVVLRILQLVEPQRKAAEPAEGDSSID